MGREGWAGGWSWGAELGTEIQGDYGARACGMELRTPATVGNRLGETWTHRIGRLPVIKQLGFVLDLVGP